MINEKLAIHMQLYEPHFTFGADLIKALHEYTSDAHEFPFYIFDS